MSSEIVESIGGFIVGCSLIILMLSYTRTLKSIQSLHPSIWENLNSKRQFGVIMPTTLGKQLKHSTEADNSVQKIQTSYQRSNKISLAVGFLGLIIGTLGAAFYATYTA